MYIKKVHLLIFLIILLLIEIFNIICFSNIYNKNIVSDKNTITLKEIIVSESTEELANETKEAVNKNENISTTETIKSTIEDEENIEEENLEEDATVEQENISYEGTNGSNGLSLLGKYQGLTYYSQADSRWANVMYSSTGNKSQTMKSSSCGPTSAAMVVSSSKGAILPTTMANLAVDNGYRTANNGTAWSYFSFVADYFEFNEYYSTSSFNKAMNYLSQKRTDGSAKYFAIASCGTGLFTTGGHYIVLIGLNNDTIEVYDPYLYRGKFDTASRRIANVIVDGNSAYVTKSNFKKYANYRNFWIFSNDSEVSNTSSTSNTSSSSTNATASTKTMYVKVNTSLNVRKGPGTNYAKIGSKKNGDKVTVYETNGNWSRIGTNKWVCSTYLTDTQTDTIKNTVGKYKYLKSRTVLYSKSNLSGTKYYYLKNTKVKILKNVSTSVDYIYIPATGRYAYTKNNVYK